MLLTVFRKPALMARAALLSRIEMLRFEHE